MKDRLMEVMQFILEQRKAAQAARNKATENKGYFLAGEFSAKDQALEMVERKIYTMMGKGA